MKYHTFLNTIPKIQKASLPAIQSHLKMAPMDRIKMLELWDFSKLAPKKAGVLALFYPKGVETYMVLILRSANGVHSSQISFPGGRYEAEDELLINTAKRETFEEVGIAESDIHIVKELSQLYVPPSNFLISPFLGYLEREPLFIPCSNEVAEIIEVPLVVFMNTNPTNYDIQASYSNYVGVPAYNINNQIIWGATAMILSELKDVLTLSLEL